MDCLSRTINILRTSLSTVLIRADKYFKMINFGTAPHPPQISDFYDGEGPLWGLMGYDTACSGRWYNHRATSASANVGISL